MSKTGTFAVVVLTLVCPLHGRAQGIDVLAERQPIAAVGLGPEAVEWTLVPLRVTSDLSAGVAGLTGAKQTAVFLPNINAEASVHRDLVGGRLQFKGSGRATFASKPSVGDATTVADQIRLVGGTAAVNVAARLGWRWNAPSSPGTLGIQARVGFQGGLQLADLAATNAMNEVTLSSSGFLIGRFESAVGLWLYFAYVGAQLSLHAVGSKAADLKAALSIPSLQLVLIAPLRFLNSDDRTFYFQVSASGPWNAIDQTVTLSLGARFDPF